MAFWNRSSWESKFRNSTKDIRRNLAQLADLGLDILDLESKLPNKDPQMWLKEIETACDGLAAETNTTAESLRKMAQVIASSRSTEEYLNDLSALGNASKQQGDAQESLLRGLDERQVKRHWINEEVVPKGPDKIVGVLDTRQTAARWLVTNLFIERYLREAALPDIKARRIRTHALELLQGSRTRIQLLEGA